MTRLHNGMKRQPHKVRQGELPRASSYPIEECSACGARREVRVGSWARAGVLLPWCPGRLGAPGS